MAALLACLFLAAAAAPCRAGAAELLSGRHSLPPEEDFTYSVDFLIFTNVATGRLRIQRTGGLRYRAELMAETRGLIGFLTSYRKNRYVSEMTYDPARKRLVTRRYTKSVHRGKNVSRYVVELDHARRRIRWQALRNGTPIDGGDEPFPEGAAPEDPLSAFFNLRLGAYGPIERGRKFTIPSLPDYEAERRNPRPSGEKLDREFRIRIADAETERLYRRRYGREKERGILAFVKVPRDLFRQETGEVRIWLDDRLIPTSATVERAFFFGDVRGTLQRAIVRPAGESR